MKPLTENLPYPSMDGIEKNRFYAALISDSYAGRHGELNAILQYIYQSFYFIEYGELETADILISIGLAEMEHLEILGKLLLILGRSPEYCVGGGIFSEYYSAASVSYSNSPEKMITDDITAEMVAVKSYAAAIEKISDEKVGAILERIRLDEELHIKTLGEILKKIKK